MRKIDCSTIKENVKEMCFRANFHVNADVRSKLKEFAEKETNDRAKHILELILKNHKVAVEKRIPLCQDTGIVIVFVEMGSEVHITGGVLNKAIQDGVKEAYDEFYLRKSIVKDPLFDRQNTGTNTPAIIYTEITEGRDLKITVLNKGAGSENVSCVKMMPVDLKEDQIVEFVVDHVKKNAANACAPVIVGIGIGGTIDYCALLAKKALLRDLYDVNSDEKWNKLEERILKEINETGTGPQGLGGNTTAIGVKIMAESCHIASMPLAVNMQCHAARHSSVEI